MKGEEVVETVVLALCLFICAFVLSQLLFGQKWVEVFKTLEIQLVANRFRNFQYIERRVASTSI